MKKKMMRSEIEQDRRPKSPVPLAVQTTYLLRYP